MGLQNVCVWLIIFAGNIPGFEIRVKLGRGGGWGTGIFVIPRKHAGT
jgi:hypothetical protein